ncbi:MAG: nicotinate (nicotinamide) nucleotide adenylyltransferase [Bacteroidota bacterium]
MNIGLFFGSFNPIHIGHLIVANIMANADGIDQVWFVVSPQNPFKKSANLLHEFDRYDMVEKAIADNPKLKVSDIEFSMPKPSYTIDTLARLTEKYPNHTFKLIIGEDNLSQFSKWKNADKILEYYGLLVYPRPKAEPHNYGNHHNVQFIEAPLLDISATFIRNQLLGGKSIKYMVPEVVEGYIQLKKLYQ